MVGRAAEAIIEFHFIGPGGIGYVNPADDPRRRTETASSVSGVR